MSIVLTWLAAFVLAMFFFAGIAAWWSWSPIAAGAGLVALISWGFVVLREVPSDEEWQ